MTENNGFLKVAAAIPACNVADVRYNCSEISLLIKKAFDDKVHVILFPELCITGYSCGDLFFSNTLLDAAQEGLQYILKNTSDFDIISIVGLPVYDGVHLYNCAAVLHKGIILGIVPKTYIPNYGEFFENRWFFSGEKSNVNTLEFCGQNVPFGKNIIFDCGQLKIAVEICEDMWVGSPPSVMHALHGANVIFNPSASNAVIGKKSYRKMLVKQRSFTSKCGYVYVSAGAGESTTDTLYCGHSIVAENGSILIDKDHLSFESNFFCTEIDLERLESDRKKHSTFDIVSCKDAEYNIVKVAFSGSKIDSLTRRVEPFPFIPRSDSDKNERMSEIYNILALSLAKRLKHIGIKSPVIGISGGLDSTLALLVTVRAADILELKREDIIAITMPGFEPPGVLLKTQKAHVLAKRYLS